MTEAGVYICMACRDNPGEACGDYCGMEHLIAHKLRAGRSDGLVFATRRRDAVRLLGGEGTSGQSLATPRKNA